MANTKRGPPATGNRNRGSSRRKESASSQDYEVDAEFDQVLGGLDLDPAEGSQEPRTRPLSGKELALQLRKQQILEATQALNRQELAQTRGELAQTRRRSPKKSKAKKRRKSDLAEEDLDRPSESPALSFIQTSRSNARHSQSSSNHSQRSRDPSDGSDSYSSGSETEDPGKENMAGPTRRQQANQAAQQKADAAQEKANQEAAERLASENAQLKKQLVVAIKNSSTLVLNNDEKDNVEANVKYIMFMKYQFNVHDKDTERITKKLYIKMFEKDTRKASGRAYMSQWIKTYSPVVSNIMGQTRGYRCQELRKVCLEYARQHRNLPTTAQIYECLVANVDLEDEAQRDIYVWYWDKCCPAVTMATNWPLSVRRHLEMHKAVSGRDHESPVFTPELKAFLYMLYANNRERWIAGGKWLRDNPDEKLVPKKPPKAERTADMDMTMYDAQYSSNELGKIGCGWSEDSFKIHKTILAELKDAHANEMDRIKAKEAEFLPILQEALNCQAEKKSKKRKANPLANLEINEFSEDEDDFADSQGTAV